MPEHCGIAVVSIHASTWGATDDYRDTLKKIEVSIHAPTRGATSSSESFWHPSVCFNPRSHAGSDSEYDCGLYGLQVSIHAPTRGATYLAAAPPKNMEFQSTLPRGERPEQQSRTARYQVSIHAPTRGATLHLSSRHSHRQFQSTLPRGERPFR